jgi:D-beta-D-heptose 7-phosphate kinase / D-beta-D-heptose 1-phosphate adenosyltransferase
MFISEPTRATESELECLSAARPRLLVLGDVMLDCYVWGKVIRISQETPTPILHATREEAGLGGAACVAFLLANMGADVRIVGVCADDTNGRQLRAQLQQNHVDDDQLFNVTDRPTTSKQRVMGCANGRDFQQVMRIDRESAEPISEQAQSQLFDACMANLSWADAVLVSDYGKGVCREHLIESVIDAARCLDVPVLVDPARQGEYDKYRHATIIKPNRAEAASATSREIKSVEEGLAAANQLRQRLDAECVVVTLDADGLVMTADGGVHSPIRGDGAILDTTGAGDTVLAVLGWGLAAKADVRTAAEAANLAAAVQVSLHGIAQVSWSQIIDYVRPEERFQDDRPLS